MFNLPDYLFLENPKKQQERIDTSPTQDVPEIIGITEVKENPLTFTYGVMLTGPNQNPVLPVYAREYS